jgi:hypothetical protein
MDITKFLCSATAAATAEFLTFPIDTAKTVLQLKDNKINLKDFIKVKNMSIMYKGSGIAVSRQFYLGGIVYSSYTPIKNKLNENFQNEYIVKIVSGGIAGGLGQFLATPLDVMKVNVQAQRVSVLLNKTTKPDNLYVTVKNVYNNHGFKGFTRGWIPNVQRSAILNSVGLPVYDITKSKLISSGYGDNTRTHVISSAASGLCAVTAELPFDTVKTRLMTDQGNMTTLSCFRDIIKKEGVRTLWSGFLPAYVRLGPWQITFFVIYEHLNKITGNKI